jgi:hypothetical protein
MSFEHATHGESRGIEAFPHESDAGIVSVFCQILLEDIASDLCGGSVTYSRKSASAENCQTSNRGSQKPQNGSEKL